MIKENDRNFRGKEVRVIGENGEQLGLLTFEEAVSQSQKAGLDLVLVADKVTPPVIRIMNFGKLVYEQKKKERDQKKNNIAHKVKEIKFSLRINENDYECKIDHAVDFFKKGYKVKVTLQFTGRELAHKEIGFELYNRIQERLAPYGIPDSEPNLVGRSIIVGYNPKV